MVKNIEINKDDSRAKTAINKLTKFKNVKILQR